MDYIFAKLKLRASENEKYRRVLASDDRIFPDIQLLTNNSVEYNPKTILGEEGCFKITDFSEKDYCNKLIKEGFCTPDFNQLIKEEFTQIDYIFVLREGDLLFQNVSKSKLVAKKRIFHVGEDFIYESNHESLQIKLIPDAVYVKATDTLYFRKLESITSIFKGITELYREATNQEVEQFLNSDFIRLENNFSFTNVKTSNRKRIAMALKTLENLNDVDKQDIITYISGYCTQLDYNDGVFTVGSETALTQILYGIEQRFYTTPIGSEKRLANSVIKLPQD